MPDQHPTITPPPELVRQWIAEIWHEGTPVQVAQSDMHLATRAAQWGADQLRRPKPPTLAEQGMEALRLTPCTKQRHYDALFAALNRLAELEDSND